MKITNLAEDIEEFTGETWLIENEEKKALIDTGTKECWDKIGELGELEKVIITHSHSDHVENLPKVVEKFDCRVFAYDPENISVKAEKLKEGEKVELAGKEFKVFHTPGHKNDSICLYNMDEKILFTGDLIFPEGSFGRTDLAEGNREKLIESIKKISKFDVEKFYSGHGKPVLKHANESIKESLENAEKREPKY
jgi:glyoxylase-like metal-dependent hydrolase (beta-lactamase superfamily II)